MILLRNKAGCSCHRKEVRAVSAIYNAITYGVVYQFRFRYFWAWSCTRCGASQIKDSEARILPHLDALAHSWNQHIARKFTASKNRHRTIMANRCIVFTEPSCGWEDIPGALGALRRDFRRLYSQRNRHMWERACEGRPSVKGRSDG